MSVSMVYQTLVLLHLRANDGHGNLTSRVTQASNLACVLVETSQLRTEGSSITRVSEHLGKTTRNFNAQPQPSATCSQPSWRPQCSCHGSALRE